MKELTFFPGDYITNEGDMDETMYFIHQGKVEVLIEEEHSWRFKEVLYAGQTFGLVSMWDIHFYLIMKSVFLDFMLEHKFW